MRTLAIDLGTRRVGLALSDQGGKWATPHDVLTVASPEQALQAVLSVIEKEGVERLLVGVPLNMDDTIGPAARSAMNWAKTLAARADRPLVLVDERLSSFVAGQQLAARKKAGEKLTHAKKKQQIDAVAAAGFLQEFLDGRLAEFHPPGGIRDREI